MSFLCLPEEINSFQRQVPDGSFNLGMNVGEVMYASTKAMFHVGLFLQLFLQLGGEHSWLPTFLSDGSENSWI